MTKRLLVVVCLLISVIANALNLSITDVKHLRRGEGLSSQRVFNILEDKHGAIWISTRAGVDRFNGREIRNYERQGDFFYGDLAGRVIMLSEDLDGGIMAYDNIGTIYKYSEVHDQFETTYKLDTDIPGAIKLNKYFKNSKGTEIFGLTQGLFAREAGGQAHALIESADVNDVVEIGGDLYVATTLAFIKYGAQGSVTRFPELSGNCSQTLYYLESRKKLLVGTFNDGLWIYDLKSGQFTHVDAKTPIFNNPIRAFQKIDDQTVGVGIDGGGVYTIDVDNLMVELLINAEDEHEFSLHGNGIYAMSEDSQGDIWVGSSTGGVSELMFTQQPFKQISHVKGNKNSLSNTNVNAISENADGSIWYATDHGVSINKGSQWTHILQGCVGLSLQPLAGGKMLLGTYGEGVFMLDSNGNTLKRINKQSGTLTSNYIFSVKQDRSGECWVGALDGHLMQLDANLNKVATYPISLVHSIEVIDANRVAVATVDGFYIVDKTTGKVDHYASAEEQVNNDVSAYIVPMLWNADGTIWLGTEGGGLNLYDLATRKVLHSYKMQDGLPSNVVYCLQRDNMGRIWLGTGNGIAIFDGKEFTSLDYLNSLASEYNKNAVAKLRSGELMFGSTSGAMRYSPDKIATLNYKAPLRITGFAIEGINPDEKNAMSERIFEGMAEGSVKLAYAHNSFSISFECINLKYQEDIGYQYIMEGYDKGWSESQTWGIISYKHVMPGRYNLRIRAISLSNGSVIDEKEMFITIAQPWWNSWLAWIVYALLLGFLVWVIIRYKMWKMQKSQDEEKIRFFVNTAHDIRTPVTLAMAPLDDLKRDEPLSENAAYLLSIARQNIRKLNSITSQLLEFEKFETNRNKVDLVPVDLRDILKGEIACFSNVCKKKNINLCITLPEEPANIHGDIALLEMIFDNLISNACKYTKPGGYVAVKLEAQNSKVITQIIDNGIGIPASERKHIFTDIYRAQNARDSQEVGTGFGLLQVKRVVKTLDGTISFTSTEGEGTVFTVTFERTYEKAEQHERKTQANAMINEVVPSIVPPAEKPEVKDSTLLIVEDNEDLREYLGKLFWHDYNIELKATADEALEYLNNVYPDLIISDVMMPGMQGDDFCNLVKTNPDTSGIPVILLTAKTNHESIVEGITKGADDYVAKPFSSEILKLKVKGLLENRNRMRNYLLKQAMQQATDNKPIEREEPAEANLSVSDNQFMTKVTSLVIEKIADTEFNIDILCREMAMSRTLFYNRLKALTGKAPQEFVRLLRLERAAEMLRQGQSVNDVAEATGFVNVKYFSTVFKKHFGVQPSRYLKV